MDRVWPETGRIGPRSRYAHGYLLRASLALPSDMDLCALQSSRPRGQVRLGEEAMGHILVSVERRPVPFDLGCGGSKDLLRRLSADIAEATAEVSYAFSKHVVRQLVLLLRWTLREKPALPSVLKTAHEDLRRCLLAGTASSFSEDLFVQLCEHYAQRLWSSSSTRSDSSQAALVYQLRWILERLSAKRSLPRFTAGLTARRRPMGGPRGHPPLAALTKSGVIDWRTSGALRATLSHALSEAGLKPDLLTIDEMVRGMAFLNDYRLTRLRQLLEQDLLADYAVFRRGQELMADATLPSDEEIERKLGRPGESLRNGRRWHRQRWLLEASRGSPSRGLAIVLRHYRLGGSLVRERFPHAIYKFLERPDVRRDMGLVGDRVQEHLQRHLSISSTSWMAAFGLLLCDTGWNTSPLRTLFEDPFIGAVRNGRRRVGTAHVISSFKDRAGHEVQASLVDLSPDQAAFIDAYGPDSVLALEVASSHGLTAYRTILLVQEMTAPLRCHSDQPERLWLCPGLRSTRARVPSIATFRLYWTEFLRRHASDPVLGGLPISMAMIRKTRMEITAMGGPGGFGEALVRGQHLAATSRKYYLRSSWVAWALLENIRAFQDALEATVGRNIEGLSSKLGIPDDVWRGRHSLALESGLATLLSGQGASTMASQRALRFVPTDHALRQLHVADRLLTQHGAELAERHPSRWHETFYPHFIAVRALIAAIAMSPLSQRSRLARREAMSGAH